MKFILTGELGRLARWLRILGFDAELEVKRPDLVLKSLREERVILTRDSKMSRFSGVRMLKIESDYVEEQLKQVVGSLGLKIERDNLFKVCVLCNNVLDRVKKEAVEKCVPPHVFQTQSLFLKCPKCNRIYWQGSHWALVNKFLDKLVHSPRSTEKE